MTFVPLEILDNILILLGEWAGKPTQAFEVCTYFQRTHVQIRLIGLVEGLSMDNASRLGLIDVLEMHLRSNRELIYTQRAIDRASAMGRVDVLEWWKRSGLEMRWSSDAMDDASAMGRVDVLEWWRGSGLELKWSERGIIKANDSETLIWWNEGGFELARKKHGSMSKRRAANSLERCFKIVLNIFTGNYV